MLALATCLDSLGIRPSNDTNTEGAHRFHAYGPVKLFHGETDNWYGDYHTRYWGVGTPKGLGCCAPDLVSFHYVEAGEAARIWEVVHNQEKYRQMERVQRHGSWPKDVGGYSSRPKGADDPMWALLTDRIKYPACAL